MSTVMARKAAHDVRWTVLWYTLGLAFYAVVVVLLFPSTGKLHKEIDKTIPEAMRKAFGIADMGTLAGFIGGEFVNLMWPIIASVFLVMAGTAVVAQEVERGTIELWLSVPASRAHLLMSKLAVLLAGIVALVVSTLLALWAGALMIGESLALDHLLILGLVMTVFSITVTSFSALLSTLFTARGPAAGVGAAIVVGSYLAWVIAGLSSGWEWLQYASLFTPFKAQDALARGTVDFVGLASLTVTSVACVAAAVIIFNRRDAIA